MSLATFNISLGEFYGKTAYAFNFKQLVDHNDPSKGYFKQQCILMLKDYLAAQYKAHGQHASERQLQEFSCALIEETQRKLTA